ncbi:hypothetical protein FBU31_001004 [Coemansia sp. 'formosensis']|nr:hypothetical protein FBU31_001004 [Coemansia sp. 'formosensis']
MVYRVQDDSHSSFSAHRSSNDIVANARPYAMSAGSDRSMRDRAAPAVNRSSAINASYANTAPVASLAISSNTLPGSFPTIGNAPMVPAPYAAANNITTNTTPGAQSVGTSNSVADTLPGSFPAIGSDPTVPMPPAAALEVAANSEQLVVQHASAADNGHIVAQPEKFSTPGMDTTVPRAPVADIGGTVTGWLPVGWTGSIHGAKEANIMAANAHQEPRPGFGMDTTVTAPVVDVATAFCQRFKTLAHHFSVGRFHTDSPSSTKRAVLLYAREEPIGKARPFTMRRARHFAARRVLRRPGLVVYKRCAITSKLRVATAVHAGLRSDSWDFNRVNDMAAPAQQEIQVSLDVDMTDPAPLAAANGDMVTGWLPVEWSGSIHGANRAYAMAVNTFQEPHRGTSMSIHVAASIVNTSAIAPASRQRSNKRARHCAVGHIPTDSSAFAKRAMLIHARKGPGREARTLTIRRVRRFAARRDMWQLGFGEYKIYASTNTLRVANTIRAARRGGIMPLGNIRQRPIHQALSYAEVCIRWWLRANKSPGAGYVRSNVNVNHTPAQHEIQGSLDMNTAVPEAPTAIDSVVTGWLPVGWTGSVHGANGANVMAANAYHQEPRPDFGMGATVTAPVVDTADIATEFCQRFKSLARHFSVGRFHADSPSSTKRAVLLYAREEPIGKARPFTMRRARQFAARRVLRRSGLVVYKRCAITSKLRIATAVRAARRGSSQEVTSVNVVDTGWFTAGWTGATKGSSIVSTDRHIPGGRFYDNVGASSANVGWSPFGRPGASQVANSTNGVHAPIQQVIQGASGTSASIPAQPEYSNNDGAKVLLLSTAITPGISLTTATLATRFPVAAAPPNSTLMGLAPTAFNSPAVTPPSSATLPVASTPPAASTPPVVAIPPAAATPSAAALSIVNNSERPSSQDDCSTNIGHATAQPESLRTPGMDAADSAPPTVALSITDNIKHTAAQNASGINTGHTSTQQVAQLTLEMGTMALAPPTVANNDSPSNERPVGQDAGGADIGHGSELSLSKLTLDMGTMALAPPTVANSDSSSNERPAGRDAGGADTGHGSEPSLAQLTLDMGTMALAPPTADIDGTVTRTTTTPAAAPPTTTLPAANSAPATPAPAATSPPATPPLGPASTHIWQRKNKGRPKASDYM